MSKTRLLILFIFVLLFSLPLSAKAFAIKADANVYIPKTETIDGNLYAAGSSISIDGHISGDVICAGQSINIKGDVEGDVICAGQSINIEGKVNGNVRVAGSLIELQSFIARNAMTFGATVNLGPEASIGRDMLLGAAVSNIEGKIGGELHGAVATANISGDIEKNVNLKIDDDDAQKSSLNILEGARIGGNIIYSSQNKISVIGTANVGGDIIQNIPEVNHTKKKENNINWAWGRIFSIFSSLVIGLVLISLWGKPVEKITDLMFKKYTPSIAFGFAASILIPVSALILMLTIIGIPLAIIVIMAWVAAIWISKILVSILIGRKILENFWKKRKDSLLIAMVLGVVVTYLIFSIPFIGWIIAMAAIWWGLGGIYLFFKR